MRSLYVRSGISYEQTSSTECVCTHRAADTLSAERTAHFPPYPSHHPRRREEGKTSAEFLLPLNAH